MDLNYLLHRQQVSLMRADAASSDSVRHAHHGLARDYAAQIARFQAQLGAGIVAHAVV